MRVLEPFRAGYGLCQLGYPQEVPGIVLGRRLDSRAAAVVRVLGARHLLQAAVLGLAPASPMLHRCGSVVDVLHSASMVLLAVFDRRRRSAALADAVVAGVFAAAELRAARHYVAAFRVPTHRRQGIR
ncbi:hypothetical protein IV498_01890 [Paenarthrobacter sp. Z7-10]|uniref:hypothetical protein n=1 Tax=Paenarthrobacter sp. Z7-10 TaxID=2787635 RepID=UPI0022A93064|nr:hypothetical protein [Paenarthrobacter sp. Z7-10]MCZ2401967.1 hypothetical protein [Paenarthrobacter sp. Z7-10]